MSESSFGIEPCPDGSVVIARKQEGAVSVTRLGAGDAQPAEVLEFVRCRSRSPRICVATCNGRGLNLALALGALPDAEVILTRPGLLRRAGEPVAVALANYALRAA